MMQSFFDYALLLQGLRTKDKIKLLLFALGVKPGVSFYLHVTPANVHDVEMFEHILRTKKILYCRGREKSFEEIKEITDNRIIWRPAGLWIDYDLFHTMPQKEKFLEYKHLSVRQKQIKKRNKLAGEVYGYPSCCIAHYTKETPPVLRRQSYGSYYRHLHTIDKKFPLLSYRPCSLACMKSKDLQKKYGDFIKRASPFFWKHLQEVIPYETDVLIECENDVLATGKSIWKIKDGHDYIVLSMTPHEGKYWFYSVFSRKEYPLGTVIHATIKHHVTYGEVLLGREKGMIPDLYHERHLPLLERGF